MDTITVLVLSALGLFCIIPIVNSFRKSPEENKEQQQKLKSPEVQKEWQQKNKEEANAQYNRTVQQRFKC